MKKVNKILYREILLFILISILPIALILNTIITGNIDFGYDTARDFIIALNNHEKLTLIGPTSGIPGIFYGPYWIWLISFGLLFSQDPRVVVFLILTIPYLVIFPYFLFRFKSIFGFINCLLLWWVFIMGSGMKYAASAWNPHPAPLFFLVAAYLLVFMDLFPYTNKTKLKSLLVGILLGLIINFHISFGLGITLGIAIYFLIDFVFDLQKNKEKLLLNAITHTKRAAMIGLGIILVYIPFFLFEVRHGFNQIKTAINVITTPDSVVAVQGLSDQQIIQVFFDKPAELLKIPQNVSNLILVFSVMYFIYLVIKKKISLNNFEIRLVFLLISTTIGILFLYINSKNPVWSYHFIGVELFFLLAIGVLLKRIKFLNYIFAVWIFSYLVINSANIVKQFFQSPYVNPSSLSAEKKIVDIIINDAGKSDFTVFAYSPSIYTYEYSYIFKWHGNLDFPYDPGQNLKKSNLVYLIIPYVKPELREDFINHRTPNDRFKTVKTWKLVDESEIVKREYY